MVRELEEFTSKKHYIQTKICVNDKVGQGKALITLDEIEIWNVVDEK